MKLTPEQLAAAAELLKRRVRALGGPVVERARELCAGELRGWCSAEELAGAYEPDVSPGRWVGGEHDRGLDYYDPADLEERAGSVFTGGNGDNGEGKGGEVSDREIVGRVLSLLEPGGRLLQRKIMWREVRYTLRAGEAWRMVRGAGSAREAHPAGSGALVEWDRGAVLIERGGVVVRIFPEHRARGMSGGRLVMQRPEIEASGLELRRLAMSAAVLLLILRRPAAGLENGALIARAAGVTRANVSARRVKLEGELAAQSSADSTTTAGKGKRRAG